MTIKATKFTPEVLLSSPRRSPGIPNRTGKLVLYTVSTYSFEKHVKTIQARIFDIASETSRLVGEFASFSDPAWISESEFIFLVPKDDGTTRLFVVDVEAKDHPREVRSFNGSLSNVKTKSLSKDETIIVCSAPTSPDGTMYLSSAAPKSHTSARIYSGLFVRHWDTWNSSVQSSLWYGVLRHTTTSTTTGATQWKLAEPGLINLLAGTRLSSPVPPFGGAADFDVSTKGIAFVAKDPELSPALYTKTDLYYSPLSSFTEKPSSKPQQVKTGKLQGYSMSPSFSPDARSIAFARMANRQYESDKTHLLLIPDVEDLTAVLEFYETEDGEGSWDRRPDSVIWSADGKELYVTAEDTGSNVLFKLPASTVEANKALPVPIFRDGSVIDVQPLGVAGDSESPNLVLISNATFTENSCYSTVDPSVGMSSRKVISSSSRNGRALGLNPEQRSEIWFPGAAGYDVHAHVVRPSDFDENKKYPLAMLIHGGPQVAWLDGWSTRWNPAVFAEQGYIAVMPNFTGSGGYGKKHCDDITEQWGGKPYEDIVKCFEYVKEKLPYVDTDNAVALGASYGGYMINWIQGHDLGRKFKALVCHDGVFSTQNQWSTEELFFPMHDFGGTLWDKRDTYQRWDPSLYTGEWATPQLVIHNELDYRLPVSEGLAMFNVLQAREVPSKFVMFPDENHWVLKPENSIVWHREVIGWINKYSGVSDKQAESSVTGAPEKRLVVG